MIPPPEDAMPLTTADRLSIHELVALHGHIADDRRPQDLDQLLTSDGAYDVSAYGLGVVRGLEAVTRLFAAAPVTSRVAITSPT